MTLKRGNQHLHTSQARVFISISSYFSEVGFNLFGFHSFGLVFHFH